MSYTGCSELGRVLNIHLVLKESEGKHSAWCPELGIYHRDTARENAISIAMAYVGAKVKAELGKQAEYHDLFRQQSLPYDMRAIALGPRLGTRHYLVDVEIGGDPALLVVELIAEPPLPSMPYSPSRAA